MNSRQLKNELLEVIIQDAALYKDKLLNKTLVFIYDDSKKLKAMETIFLSENYLHLTGIELKNAISAEKFFEKCLSKKIVEEDFLIKDVFTELKLSVLDKLINIENTAKMIGDFDKQRPKLFTEKIVGNIYACIGFIKRGEQFYVPNTSLKEDVRDVVTHANRVIAIYSKGIQDREYDRLLYKAKGIDLDESMIPKELKGRVQFEKEKKPLSGLETAYRQLQGERDIKPGREENER